MKVAVIGGGLVGRLATWAAMLNGHTPTIFDRIPEAIIPRGFVYLHDNCELPLTGQSISVITTGAEEGYSLKVYGNSNQSTSFKHYAIYDEVVGYSPTECLNILNGVQHGMVKDVNFENLDEILTLRESYDRVIFTLPITMFCKGNFPSIKGSVGVYKLNEGEVLNNFCIYSGNLGIPWSRSGSMFGYAFREFPTVVAGHRVIIKVQPGDKPPTHTSVLFTGRYGSWTKQLSTESFREVMNWVK
mgnify:CR=1 FL=1